MNLRPCIAVILAAVCVGACDAPRASAPAPTAAPAAEPSAAASPSPAATPTVIEYDLGPAVIEQALVSGERQNLPYRIQGQLGVPAGGGRRPLVVVAHGSHAGCPVQADAIGLEIDTWPCSPEQEQRNDRGWRYLVELLARQGYVAVAPNMNAIHTTAWGGNGSSYERFAAVVDSTLDQLAAADAGAQTAFGVDLVGRIDLARTALVGHSQGGGYAILYAAERATAPAERGGPLAAALLVAPFFLAASPQSAATTVPAPDLPLGIVMGLCDGDVTGLDGLAYYQAARSQQQRASAVQLVMLYGANHNFFNSVLGPDGLDPLGAPGCDRPAGRLEPAQQQAFLAAYVGDFFAGVFDGAPVPAAWQAGVPAPQQLYGVPALTALLAPAAQRQELLTLAGEGLPGDPAGVVVTASAPLTAEVCAAQSAACRLAAYAIPPVIDVVAQSALRLSWEAHGGELGFTLPENQRDLSSFAAVQLRVALDGYEAARSGAQALRVELRDAAGGRATVTLPAETLALQPPSAAVRDADQPQPYLQGNAPLAAVRVPLAAFTGVDLSQVESLALVFDQNERGALFMTDIELLR